MLESNSAAKNTEPAIGANTTTKDELLSRAKTALDKGEDSLREAAEALALAQQDHKATQREMAKALGRSATWVNRLLKWKRSGYKDHSPFGPTTKVDRVAHAQQRARATKSPKNQLEVGVDDAERTAQIRKNEYAKKELASETETFAGADALAEFMSAVDLWVPKMDDGAKREAINYARLVAGV
jgi:hypothetical protein